MATGDKKYGRNKKEAERYKMLGTREKNKRTRIARHNKRMAENAARREFYAAHGMSPAAYAAQQATLPRRARGAA